VLSPEILATLLPSKKLNESLFVFQELPSTNRFALELAKLPVPQGTAVLADCQTEGQGRLQRTWFSPPNANIYGSIVFVLNTNKLQVLGWIPLMAGLAIAEALKKTTTIDVNLKWPNDLLIEERKVGGILCESFKQSTSNTCVVIGFGINVNLAKSAFPKEIAPDATSLQIQTQRELNRHQLITSIIRSLEMEWDTLISKGSEDCRRRYTAQCSTLGKQIQVQFPDGSQMEGLAQSLGEQGQLQIRPSETSEQSARMIDVHAGDIRHIRKSKNQSSQ
jgi:BirA family biotin operon repressor/biotin-[acetyl-CoA-carboxylase] ligase